MSDNPSAHKDTFWMLCEEQIGQGIGRTVYSSRILKDCVVKVESNSGSFQNIIEWETWNRVKETPFAKWFAPCEWISPNGIVLVMKRTTPIAKYPEKMPVFLTDFKKTNYGLYNKKVVCHDYGTNLLFEYGMNNKLKRADWWEL